MPPILFIATLLLATLAHAQPVLQANLLAEIRDEIEERIGRL